MPGHYGMMKKKPEDKKKSKAMKNSSLKKAMAKKYGKPKKA